MTGINSDTDFSRLLNVHSTSQSRTFLDSSKITFDLNNALRLAKYSRMFRNSKANYVSTVIGQSNNHHYLRKRSLKNKSEVKALKHQI